jgi:endo-1,4-beta-xylanase
MPLFSYLLIALSVALGSLAAPTDRAAVQPDLAEREPDLVLSGSAALDARSIRPDFSLNYTDGTGVVDFSNSTDGYSVKFSGSQNFAVGRGWRNGTDR